ncbi:hypothetical protein JOC75_003940 [Metabacillus crassostreae]|uniref:hypothetical protein n=1 Tax=Metabacillus crassostreae TaxID=929098 RepID=UPI00195E343D|nr:hypothetical protein [Metabacillus crassostreae]MBM7605912.1 hypothetical protein [Metabacillus crassostreae]
MIKKIALLCILTLILLLLLASYSTNESIINISKKVSSVSADETITTNEKDYVKVEIYTITEIVDNTVQGISEDQTIISFDPANLHTSYKDELVVGMKINAYFIEGPGGLMIEKIEPYVERK